MKCLRITSNFCSSFVECAKVVLTLSDMETVDRSPELHLEEIEAADTETSGGRPAEASAETLDVKPAEDRHTPSPTSHTEATKRIPTWKLVYYGSALLIVVAVWTVALLPSVLTFSIVRSPVQVIYMCRPGYHLLRESTSWGDNSNPSCYKVAITQFKAQLPNMAHL